MKRESGGVTSEAQKLVHEQRKAQGFHVYTLAGGIDEFKEIISLEGIPCNEHIDGNHETPF